MAIQIAKDQIKNNAVDSAKLDLSDNYSFSGTLSASTPSADSDVAIKSYVDGLVSGLHWKKAVRAATTANITLSGTQTVDGVSLSADDRILVKDQTDATANGIYLVASGAWTRADDMDESSEFPASAVFVTAGTVNDNLGFVCTNDTDPVLGTDNIEFTQFNGAANITAGDGLSKTGNELSVNVDGSSLEISGDSLQVASLGITDSMLAGNISNGKLANSTISGVALGSSLASLSASASSGLNFSASYDGSTAVTLGIDLDGSTLALGAGGLSVSVGGITTLQIADGNVTAGKLSQSAGSEAVITDAIRDLAVTADKLASNAVVSAKINAGAVTTAKIANDAIDQSKIADGAVQREHLNSNVVNIAGAVLLDPTNNDLKVSVDNSTIGIASNALELKDNAVTTAKLAGTSVTSDKLSDGAVTTAKIADGAVSASKVGANTLTTAKMAFIPSYESIGTGDGSATTFDTATAGDSNFLTGTIVFRNGLAMELVDGTPSGQDQYKINPTGGVGGSMRITFGSAPDNGDVITCMYFTDDLT